jgi:hypothetical protein
VKYHDWLKPEIPKPTNMWRYGEVAERSGAFKPGTADTFTRRDSLAVTWLEHLLLLSMLQHESGEWTRGRYVVVHPAANTSVAEGLARYRGILADDSTFSTIPLEDLLEAGALPERSARSLRDRYLPG